MRVVVLGAMDIVAAASGAPSGEIARRVLAVLVADANRPVHPDRLAHLVWPGSNRAGRNSLQAHISRWRKALGAHRITYSPAGYTLVLGPDELDAFEFEELARAATSARNRGDGPAALALCRAALALWRGPAFADLDDKDCVHARRAELDAGRAAVRLTLLELLCESGAWDEVLSEATVVAEADPWHEPVHRTLARAHYGRGNQVAALEVLASLERRLREDLGLDLSAASQLLREQVLRQEPALDHGGSATVPTALASPSAERLGDRIATLPADARLVLHAAALGATLLDTAHLGRVLALTGAAMATALAPILASGILMRTDDGIRFASAGLRDTVADLIPPAESLDLHRRLGVALLARGGDPSRLRRAARHLAAAAATAPDVAQRAVDLDLDLAEAALAQGRYADAVRHAQRATASAEHAPASPHPGLQLVLGTALHRAGDLDAAMAAYRSAARAPGVPVEVLVRSALAHEECSLHGRRHRTGDRDPSIELLERALVAVAPDDPCRVELTAALAQAMLFAGLDERAVRLADDAVEQARGRVDPVVLARILLRAATAHDPVRGTATRSTLAQEAAEVARFVDADEIEVEALAAWVPELMRADRIDDAEDVIARVEHLTDVQDNVLHRARVPMWRAALALAAGRHDEAAVLIEDFRGAGQRDRLGDTDRIHAFQSILLALGRGEPQDAEPTLARFSWDEAFEPWRAARIAVAHALDDEAAVRDLLLPWSARRFVLARPFAGVQAFCAGLIADAVLTWGDAPSRTRLADVVAPAIGHRLVLGAGAALLDDPADAVARLRAADRLAEDCPTG